MPARSTRHIEPLLPAATPASGRPLAPVVVKRQRRTIARRKALIRKAQPVPTPTPLVRKRLVQLPVAIDRMNTMRFRRKRAHIVVRGVSIVTPTPLVRRRVLVAGSNRAEVVRTHRSRVRFVAHGLRLPPVAAVTRNRVVKAQTARLVVKFRRERAHIVMRSFVAPRRPPAALVLDRPRRWRKRPHSTILRAASTPTPTPLVRQPVFVTRNDRSIVRFRRHPLRLVHVSSTTFVPPPPAVVRNRVVTSTGREIQRYRRRHGGLVVRRIVVRPSRRASLVLSPNRTRLRRALAGRGVSVVSRGRGTAPRVRLRLLVHPARRPRAALRRGVFVGLGVRGTAGSAPVIVVGMFDPQVQHMTTGAGAPDGAMLAGTPDSGIGPGSPVASTFDPQDTGQE